MVAEGAGKPPLSSRLRHPSLFRCPLGFISLLVIYIYIHNICKYEHMIWWGVRGGGGLGNEGSRPPTSPPFPLPSFLLLFFLFFILLLLLLLLSLSISLLLLLQTPICLHLLFHLHRATLVLSNQRCLSRFPYGSLWFSDRDRNVSFVPLLGSLSRT